MAKVIGIDLGSTLSESCIIENGKPVVVVNEEGSATTPSVVLFDNGERKVGGAAKRQMVVKPKETVNLIKRFMGATYSESADAIKHVQYDVIEKNNKPFVKIDDREYSAEEISSIIVAKMKKIAEEYVGEEIKDAVITVPAYFSDTAKAATKTAGELAGLNVLRVIAEPTAAILSSNIDKVKGGKYIVVDFGGSTLDFSVADVSDNVVEILSSYGNVYCGGYDIDKKLASYVLEQFEKDNGISLAEDAMAMSRIMEAVEKAKIELSSAGSTEINIPYITAKDNVPLHLTMTLTRAKFEQLIKPIIDDVINCGKIALEKSKLNKEDLDGVLLVGGSCRIPVLQERLIETFGDKLIKSSNLDLAVAEGAAIQASILSGETNSDILLLDVTPLTLGIETMGGVMTTLIEGNTTIPCKKQQTFTTAADNQSAVTIHVLQGERPLARDNKSLGMFNLDGIAPARRGIPQIEVTFDIDANGILSVSATDKATGKEQHITIKNDNTLSKEEIERIKNEAKLHEEEDKKTKERLEKQNKCDSAIYQIEQLMDNYKDKPEILTEEDKTFLNEKIEQFKAQKDCDYANCEELIKEAEARMMSIGAKAYQGQGAGNFANRQGNFDPSQFADMFGGMGQTAGTTTPPPSDKKSDVEEV